MKSFTRYISEVAQPESPEEKKFKDQHTYEVINHPHAEESQFTGEIKKQAPKRKADTKGDEAKYDAAYESVEESVQDLEEISKKTLGSYIKKSSADIADAGYSIARNEPGSEGYKRSSKKYFKRSKGVARAADRLAKNEAADSASPDESSMAIKQAEFIEYVGREMKEHLQGNKEFPEWMQNKLSKLQQAAQDLHSNFGSHGSDDMDESLVGGQKKLDHNKNGKLDAHDFKLMRSKKNEEVSLDEQTMTSADLEEGHATWEVSFKTQGHKPQTVKGRNTAEAIKKAEKRATAAHPKKQLAMYKGIKKVSEDVELQESTPAYHTGSIEDRSEAHHDQAQHHFDQAEKHTKNGDKMAASVHKAAARAHVKAGMHFEKHIGKDPRAVQHATSRAAHAATQKANSYNESVEVNETTNSATKKPVNVTGPDGKTRTVMRTTRANQTDEKGQDKIKTNESVEMLDETFKQGIVKLNDKSSLVLKKEDAEALNKLFKGMSAASRKKMTETAMANKKGFAEILEFAKEAL